jgi:GntR family transcriptional regulator
MQAAPTRSASRAVSAAAQAPAFSPLASVALHHQIKEDLLLRLRSGLWAPASEIPPEPALCLHYGVSRGTLRRAIGELVSEGYLERYRGRGTFVCQPKIESGLAGSFGRFTVIGPSLEPHSRVLFCRRERAHEAVASMLGVAPGTPVWHLERVRFAGERPAALQASFIEQRLAPGLDKRDLASQFLLELLNSTYGIALARAVELVDPTVADGYVAKHLELRPGTALFRVERTIFTMQERIAEYRRSLLRGDIFRYRNEFR